MQIHSDSDFLKEHMESVERTPGRNTLVTDGAYSGEANRQLADDKNIDLVTTDLLGRDARGYLCRLSVFRRRNPDSAVSCRESA